MFLHRGCCTGVAAPGLHQPFPGLIAGEAAGITVLQVLVLDETGGQFVSADFSFVKRLNDVCRRGV
jgi:hypothetical protein